MARLGSGHAVTDHDARIASLERQVKALRAEIDAALKLAATAARDDTIDVLAQFEVRREQHRR